MRWPWQPPLWVRQRVIVNLRESDAPALRGVLWDVSRQWVTLKQAEALTEREPPKPLDGDVLVPRDRVLFMQVLW